MNKLRSLLLNQKIFQTLTPFHIFKSNTTKRTIFSPLHFSFDNNFGTGPFFFLATPSAISSSLSAASAATCAGTSFKRVFLYFLLSLFQINRKQNLSDFSNIKLLTNFHEYSANKRYNLDRSHFDLCQNREKTKQG